MGISGSYTLLRLIISFSLCSYPSQLRYGFGYGSCYFVYWCWLCLDWGKGKGREEWVIEISWLALKHFNVEEIVFLFNLLIFSPANTYFFYRYKCFSGVINLFSSTKWMATHTVPFFVYWGMHLADPPHMSFPFSWIVIYLRRQSNYALFICLLNFLVE